MSSTIPTVPLPPHEPVKSYAPGSPERAELKAKLAELAAEPAEIPLFIGGEEVRTGDVIEVTAPHDQAFTLGGHDVGRLVQFVLAEHPHVQKKRPNRLHGNGDDGICERLGPDPRRELERTPVPHQPRSPVNVDQPQDIPGIDQVGVRNLRIDVPYLRPQPGLAEKTCRNIPARIPLDHHVAVRVVIPQLRRLGRRRHQQGQKKTYDMFDHFRRSLICFQRFGARLPTPQRFNYPGAHPAGR